MTKEKKYKDEKLTYYKIKITRLREVKGFKSSRTYKDKLWCVDCQDFAGNGIAFCETTLKKAFKTLEEELYL